MDLLRELVACPSVSGSEAAVAALVTERARALGLDVTNDDTGVKIVADSGRPGPALALVSHLDVVPPGEDWTRDPWTPTIEGDLLYGRGSGDAKASVASMLLALADAAPSIAGGGWWPSSGWARRLATPRWGGRWPRSRRSMPRWWASRPTWISRSRSGA